MPPAPRSGSRPAAEPPELDAGAGEAPESDSGVSIETKAEFEALAPPCPDEPLALRVEALLLGSDRPLGDGRIATILALSEDGAAAMVRGAIEELNSHYQQTGRSFRIEKVAGGWQVMTLPTFGPVLSRLHRDRQQARLSQAALETMAIIAYRQPILRADIETIRGVACGEVLRSLLERRLIKVVGRAEELGRPMLYGTTREFLKAFGLANLDDLPAVQGLKGGAAAGRPRREDELGPPAVPAEMVEAKPPGPPAP